MKNGFGVLVQRGRVVENHNQTLLEKWFWRFGVERESFGLEKSYGSQI